MNIKKITISFLLILLGSVPFSASAQKFAYVDSDYILGQMPSYKSAQTQLNELSKEWQEEIDAMYAEIDRLYKEYQAEKVLLTKEMQTKRENEIIEKERKVKKLQNDYFGFEGELFTKRQELIKPIQDKVYEAITAVAKDNALDFIFDKSGELVMLVSNPKYDRSDEVLEELGIVPNKDAKTDNKDNPPGSNDLPPDDSDQPDDSDGDLPPR